MNVRSHQKLNEARQDFLLGISKGVQCSPNNTLNWVLASITEKNKFMLLQATLFAVTCCRSPRNLIIDTKFSMNLTLTTLLKISSPVCRALILPVLLTMLYVYGTYHLLKSCKFTFSNMYCLSSISY